MLKTRLPSQSIDIFVLCETHRISGKTLLRLAFVQTEALGPYSSKSLVTRICSLSLPSSSPTTSAFSHLPRRLWIVEM